MTAERWLPVVGYEGLYEVSDLGNVRTAARTVRRGMIEAYQIRPRLLAFSSGGRADRYLRVMLTAGKKRHAYVHRLVCEAFRGPAPSPDHVVCHLDDRPHHNTAANLTWGTKSENELDKYVSAVAAEYTDKPEAPF